jgi:hypothetical protein
MATSENIYDKEGIEEKYSDLADKLRERQEQRKASERVFTLAENNQKGQEVTLDRESLARRKSELAERLVKNREALAEQAETIRQNSEEAHDHLLEIASGVYTTAEDGHPEYVAFDSPEVPELSQLEAEYEKAKAGENAAGMARLKKRIAAVKNEERQEAAILEDLRRAGIPDAVSREAFSESLEDDDYDYEEEESEIFYAFDPVSGASYSFDSESEAEATQREIDQENESLGYG